MELKELNWLCKHMKTSEAANLVFQWIFVLISVKHKFFPGVSLGAISILTMKAVSQWTHDLHCMYIRYLCDFQDTIWTPDICMVSAFWKFAKIWWGQNFFLHLWRDKLLWGSNIYYYKRVTWNCLGQRSFLGIRAIR